MASGRGVQRVLAKLQKSLDEGNYYEAHQMYRTLYFRYNGQSKFTEAIDLLYNGSLGLLNAKQFASGTDLALLLVETLDKSSTKPSSETLEKLGKLHSLMEKDSVERPTFVGAAVRWSSAEQKFGHPELHKYLAHNLWLERSYSESRYHYVRSNDGEECASMLIEYQITAGFPSEVDLFIAQTVMQCLCLKNKLTANSCFVSYTQQHPQVESGPPFVRPLLNFLWLLLLACDGGTVAVFTILVEQYQPTLRRDPTYNEYLDRIGQLFFGVPPPRSNNPSGMIGNLLSSLFSADDEDETEEEADVINIASNATAFDLD
ncbi:hypothetical protein CAPTEDRAFT_220393 [Capitella teleta]|uniref:Golgi to ER traffic protein 4 homolog n=1 Tax=Capitella teleta TaxID=283909 RepID=R7UV47_CAPTE|nr:hypothetical protein CAPTEDRAFT_220393 [Capitella teleta]|eukprot:ELU07266.1 hypothetical protein CAPTEDRAFT_220393 [Capitella teleta]